MSISDTRNRIRIEQRIRTILLVVLLALFIAGIGFHLNYDGCDSVQAAFEPTPVRNVLLRQGDDFCYVSAYAWWRFYLSAGAIVLAIVGMLWLRFARFFSRRRRN